jgi:hypothetical protein
MGAIVGTDRNTFGLQSTSITALSNGTTTCMKVRFRGDVVTSMVDSDTVVLAAVTDGAATPSPRITIELQGAATGNCLFSAQVPGDGANCAATARSNFSAGSWYVAYAHVTAGGSPYVYIQVTDDSGTVIGSQTAQLTYDPGGLATGKGVVEMGDQYGNGSGIAGAVDGLAVYTTTLSGASRYSTPASGDSNIVALYFFEQSTGSTATATVGNDLTITGTENTAWSWDTGIGSWNGAAVVVHPRQLLNTRQIVTKARAVARW